MRTLLRLFLGFFLATGFSAEKFQIKRDMIGQNRLGNNRLLRQIISPENRIQSYEDQIMSYLFNTKQNTAKQMAFYILKDALQTAAKKRNLQTHNF